MTLQDHWVVLFEPLPPPLRVLLHEISMAPLAEHEDQLDRGSQALQQDLKQHEPGLKKKNPLLVKLC